MKKKNLCFTILTLVLFGLLFSSAKTTNAQTALVAGDIAFSGYIGTGSPDEFSFVLLTNITAGTVINFTENSWLNTNVFRTGENTVTWTATSALSAGQEIQIVGTTPILASGPGSAGTVTGTALALANTGDQILAYQGTAAAPTFISGIHMNVYTTPADPVDTTAAAWDGTNSNNTNASSLPPGLITGTNAIWVGTFQTPASEFDNARYTCGTGNVSTVASTRAALNNPANWTKTNTTAGFTLPTGCPYLVVTAASASLSGRVLTASGRGILNARVTLTDSNGVVKNGRVNSFGYYRFDALQTGETYVLTVAGKGYQFAQPTQVITLNEDLTEINFIAFE